MDWLELIIGALIGGIIGFIISYFFLIKSTQKKIGYEIKSFNLITEGIAEKISIAPSLRITFGTETSSEDVKVLTSSIVILENTGYNAIVSGDISPDDPLRIIVKDEFKLYFAREIERKGTANNFDVISNNENKSVDIRFHHLNPRDGIKIQIFHSGKSNEAILICGTVVGGPAIKEKPEWKMNIGKSLIVPMISILVSMAIFVFGLPFVLQTAMSSQSGAVALTVVFLSIFVVVVYIVILIIFLKLHTLFMSKYQKKSRWKKSLL